MVSLRSKPTSMQTFLLYIRTNLQHFVVKHLMPNEINVAVSGKHKTGI